MRHTSIALTREECVVRALSEYGGMGVKARKKVAARGRRGGWKKGKDIAKKTKKEA